MVNTAAVKQYDGLKYIGDRQDAFHLAHLMRLGILPTGYIYPKEQTAYQAARLTGAFKLLQTVTGIGKILGLTIMLETGTIERFAGPGNFASYCRCVDSKRISNG